MSFLFGFWSLFAVGSSTLCEIRPHQGVVWVGCYCLADTGLGDRFSQLFLDADHA